MFDGVSEDFLGGTGKAEDAKLQGAGIIPKLCPMERVGTEIRRGNKHHRHIQQRHRQGNFRSEELF